MLTSGTRLLGVENVVIWHVCPWIELSAMPGHFCVGFRKCAAKSTTLTRTPHCIVIQDLPAYLTSHAFDPDEPDKPDKPDHPGDADDPDDPSANNEACDGLQVTPSESRSLDASRLAYTMSDARSLLAFFSVPCFD